MTHHAKPNRTVDKDLFVQAHSNDYNLLCCRVSTRSANHQERSRGRHHDARRRSSLFCCIDSLLFCCIDSLTFPLAERSTTSGSMRVSLDFTPRTCGEPGIASSPTPMTAQTGILPNPLLGRPRLSSDHFPTRLPRPSGPINMLCSLGRALYCVVRMA